MKPLRPPDYLYKQQAARLQDFLKAAGITLKHTHALEAVAHIHGAKNWHTLRHQASESTHTSTLWLISTYGKGTLQQSVFAKDLVVAINIFLKDTYVYCCLYPTEDMKVVGEKDDAGLRGLYLFVENTLCVSMIIPGWSEFQEDSPSFHFPDPEDFPQVAEAIQTAIALRQSGSVEERLQQVSRSLIAYSLAENFDEALLQQASPCAYPSSAQTVFHRAQQLWDIMSHIRTWVHAAAKVQGS